MSVIVDVSPSVLEWVINITKSIELPQSMRNQLSAWKTGSKQPTFSQVERMAKKTHLPLGYFFLDEPPVEDIPLINCRTIDSLYLEHPSRDLIDTIQNMEDVQDWTRTHLISEGYEPIPFVGTLSHETDVMRFAKAVRELLSISDEWHSAVKEPRDAFKLFKERLTNLGVLVMVNGVVGNNTRRKLNIEEFRAFCMVDSYAPLIFINTADSQAAQLFSLLHEFVHLCMGTSSLLNADETNMGQVDKIEQLCNAVAAEILVPQGSFISAWTHSKSEVAERIEELSNKFLCSTSVIARKAYDAGFINANIYKKMVKLAHERYLAFMQDKQEKKSGGDYYRNAAYKTDNRFLMMLANSVAEGKTPYTDAFRLTNTSRKSFDTLIKTIQERS